jgi:hypothetical protein
MQGHLSSGIGSDSIQALFGARDPEVVGSNPTPATMTKRESPNPQKDSGDFFRNYPLR